MIIPMTPANLAKASNAEIVAAYIDLGFDQPTAEAYLSVLRPAPMAKSSARVMSVQSLRALALKTGSTELLAEIEKSEAANIAFVQVDENDEGDVVISPPTGVMVSYFYEGYLDLEVEGGVSDPHITLAYLGDSSDLSLNQTRQVVAIVNEVAARHTQLRGVVKGTGYFADSGAWYAVPYIPGLVELRNDVVAALKAAGLPVHEDHEFTPHITLAYTDNPPAVDVAPFEINITELSATVGPYRYDAHIKPEQDQPYEDLVAWEDQKRTPFVPIAKSVDEKRFTLAPMYIPDTNDAHGDWSTPDELQSALWKFSRGEKLIAKQHRPDEGAVGEAVEFMVIPWEHTVPMIQGDGSMQDVTFPAGTPWLGVIWNEETWPLVKSGQVRGYSIGGRANLLNVQLPESE